jgi:ABC-2 type transport system ATP-binding protein
VANDAADHLPPRQVECEFVIELRNVGKSFGGSAPALQDVSFDVPAGSICALLGHNGAGKTTTVSILCTLLTPSSGHAKVAGYDVVEQAAQVRSSIGVTGQDVAVDILLTGRENLTLFGRLRGLRRKRARERADELLDQFDVVAAADRPVSTYSGGMRRRIDIAAALVVPPKVLFLDEPTTGLDPRSRRAVWALVSGLSEQGVTVLLTTQYLEEADVLSDSIVILGSGQVIASGTAGDLKRLVGHGYCEVTLVDPVDVARVAELLVDFADLEVDSEACTVAVLAADGVATLREVLRRLSENEIELIDISLRKPSLDEVFLHLTQPIVTA